MAGFTSDGKRMRVFTDRGEVISSRRIDEDELSNFVFVCFGIVLVLAAVLYNMLGVGDTVTGKSILMSVAGMSVAVAFLALFGLVAERSSFGDVVFFFSLSAIGFALHEGGWLEVVRNGWYWVAIIALLGVFVTRTADCFTRAIWEPLTGITMLCLVVLVASLTSSLPFLPVFIIGVILILGGLLGAVLLLGTASEYERGRSHLGGD